MKKIDLKTLERKIVVRNFWMDDYDQLIKLQKLCFPGMHTWTKEQIESQLAIFPKDKSVSRSAKKL